MLSDELREGLLGIVSLQELGNFNRWGRLIEFCTGRRDLNAANHVSSNDGKESHGAGRNLRANLLLQHPQEITLGEIHLEYGMKRIVPDVRLSPHWHRK